MCVSSYIPELNLLVECDGEWWHRTADRIKIDKDKTHAARLEGYRLLRISDLELSRGVDTPVDARHVLALLELTKELLFNRSLELLKSRWVKSNACFVP